eukprot:TRINITY_DN67542_c7_g8_i1.p2 TRINITY_DN67542_c7_g8~~TRINITY_DN67542_c7_g8_i1.p2  ORF type:complete len:126 (+),score=6.07 TRINITY_DN67542_c7_g8_i1:89-466(+)
MKRGQPGGFLANHSQNQPALGSARGAKVWVSLPVKQLLTQSNIEPRNENLCVANLAIRQFAATLALELFEPSNAHCKPQPEGQCGRAGVMLVITWEAWVRPPPGPPLFTRTHHPRLLCDPPAQGK